MVNTLDSMIGYKNEHYIDFGKIAARIDDGCNYLPARMSIPVISLAAQILWKKGSPAFRTAILEGRHHTSPNAGYPEAAFAGTFAIRLGGPNIYHGKLVSKPYIGTGREETTAEHIRQACTLMMISSGISLLVFWLMQILIHGNG